MHNYTRDDVFHIVEEEDVAFIRLQFTDIFGTMKNMAVTVGQLEKALDNRCMFDVSSLEGVADEEESDMYLYPDLSTFEIFPWRPQQGKVARLICDVYKKDGTPYEGDPRYVLSKEEYEADSDELMMQVLDAGAEDFSEEEDVYEVLTDPDSFEEVRKALEDAGIPMMSAEVTMIPQNYVTLTDETAVKNLQRTLELLEDDDDVQAVYHNWDE